MYQQQPMRNRPGFGPQRPSRTLMQRNTGMRMYQQPPGQQGFQQFFNPLGPVQQQPAARGGGIQGFLSKLLPGGSAAGGGTGAGFGGGGAGSGLGGIQGLANPSSISNMLGNVQKALGVAQQVTPMIQQYGPLVRNLPGMVKMFRQLNSEDSAEENAEEEKEEPEKETETSVKKEASKPEKAKSKDSLPQSGRSAPKKERKSGDSKPKLYI
ncbi:VrrA/YqfQ family protein [Bacillus sp. NSP9.1]|uniref:VrrA/YqfQ family protein n=1 Tax=Bacillus sp. NSP9.1 TaxID=1071078 RepID=UPI0003F7B681|nr:VrrA/YqfQ family protein [Bacillus sp. NSP9.1]QHZ47692.1 hypothetical protein M654_016015 [Bacillus sp. NSP9.1]